MYINIQPNSKKFRVIYNYHLEHDWNQRSDKKQTSGNKVAQSLIKEDTYEIELNNIV